MENRHSSPKQNCLMESNVTTRRAPGREKSKMAQNIIEKAFDLEEKGSLFIDSILSQDEEHDIISMMNTANELDGGLKLPSFYTSSQMGGKDPRRPQSLQLSPIGPRGVGLDAQLSDHFSTGPALHPLMDLPKVSYMNSSDQSIQDKSIITAEYTPIISGTLPALSPRSSRADGADDGANVMEEKRPADLVTAAGDIRDGTDDTELKVVVDPVTAEVDDPWKRKHDPVSDNRETGGASTPRPSSLQQPLVDGDLGNEDKQDHHSDEDSEGDTTSEIAEADPLDRYPDFETLASRLLEVDEVLKRLNGSSADLGTTVRSLESSLEFSQKEVEDLKKENRDLIARMATLELEDKRTQFQVENVDEKLDRLETTVKKKNLVFEGIPEQEGRNEDVDKTISDLFDQLSINAGINMEACYRMGPYNRHRPRPILVAFEKQVDRDLVYSKRVDVRKTTDFQRVWINEDLGQASKRKRGLIRMIAKEAQLQGIDCRTGKYALHINRVKYDSSNLEELPPQLQPTSLKQVQIDKETLAYQSEFAPFSNFFPCKITIGQHTFFCLEQAYQFLRAKILLKPLAATKIYLSRDVRFIKQAAADLGSSEEWERRQFDLMYVCLMKKFLQHPDLKALLLSTGDLQLVEATPDRLWGCGATLSSNALRRHEWPGRNKHGEILMTVRAELRRKRNQ